MRWFRRKRAKERQAPIARQQQFHMTNPGDDATLPDRPSLDGYTVRELDPNQVSGTMRRQGRDRS